MSERKNIAKAASLMFSGTLISRILGLVRDQVIAITFGASWLTDAYFVAHKIPNMLREIFAEGSMSAAVIPVLTGYEKEDPENGRKLVRTLLGFSLMAVGLVCVLGALFAPEIVSVIGFGFKSVEKAFAFETTVELARMMMPFLLFVSLASIVMAALNTKRIFFIPSLSTAMYNLTFIVIVLFLASRLERPILATAIGVSMGGLMQILFQVPRFLRQGYSILPSFRFGHPGLKRILILVLPVMAGTAVSQVNIVIGAMLATMLPFGSVTYLYYSMRLIQLPVGMIGVAMGMAILPSLSSHAHAGDMKNLKEDFAFSLKLLFFIGVPAMAGLIALRVPIVSTLFQHGDWGVADTSGTADALLFYSLGLWAVMGVKVLSSTFYSLSDTRTPVKAAIAAITANVLLSIALMGPMKHAGLALAQAIAAIVNFALLIFLLRGRLGAIGGKAIAGSFIKATVASAIMGVAIGMGSTMPLWIAPGRILTKVSLLALLIIIGTGVYVGVSALMKSEELGFMVKLFKDKFAKEMA
jgi:putative peptidoglycan lipid II flippase